MKILTLICTILFLSSCHTRPVVQVLHLPAHETITLNDSRLHPNTPEVVQCEKVVAEVCSWDRVGCYIVHFDKEVFADKMILVEGMENLYEHGKYSVTVDISLAFDSKEVINNFVDKNL